MTETGRAMFPFCQFFTLREWVRAIETIDSIAVVERNVRANDGGTFSRSTVSVSCSPSRSDPAAPGWVRSSSRARASSWGRRGQRGVGVVRPSHPFADHGAQVIGQPVGDMRCLLQFTTLDHRVVEHPSAAHVDNQP